MNLVLADTEEFRKVRRKAAKQAPGSAAGPVTEAEEKRTLGLTIVRGTNIISLSVDGPPPADPSARLGTSAPGGPGIAPPTMAAGPGISRPAGRGSAIGLTGPAPGAGGPGGFGGAFPPGGFGGPPGFAGRGGPTGAPRKSAPPHTENAFANSSSSAGFMPPQGFLGAPQGGPRKFNNHQVQQRTSLIVV